MYCALIDFATPAYDEILALRNTVLRKPLNLEFLFTDIRQEWEDLHFGCYSDRDVLLGTCSYVPKDDFSFKMRQVCVHPDCSGLGIGSYMVKGSEQELKSRFHARRIFLHARAESLPFYLRMSYIREGEKFAEVGIPHYFMFKNLSDDKS